MQQTPIVQPQNNPTPQNSLAPLKQKLQEVRQLSHQLKIMVLNLRHLQSQSQSQQAQQTQQQAQQIMLKLTQVQNEMKPLLDHFHNSALKPLTEQLGNDVSKLGLTTTPNGIRLGKQHPNDYATGNIFVQLYFNDAAQAGLAAQELKDIYNITTPIDGNFLNQDASNLESIKIKPYIRQQFQSNEEFQKFEGKFFVRIHMMDFFDKFKKHYVKPTPASIPNQHSSSSSSSTTSTSNTAGLNSAPPTPNTQAAAEALESLSNNNPPQAQPAPASNITGSTNLLNQINEKEKTSSLLASSMSQITNQNPTKNTPSLDDDVVMTDAVENEKEEEQLGTAKKI